MNLLTQVNAINFEPPDSIQAFFQSEKFISLIVGPVGSTKTSAAIMKIYFHAKKMAPCRDGIRRSRAIWVRNTREQLRDTSIPDFLKWFPDGQAGFFLKSEYKFTLKLDDVECEVLFRGLDDSNDVRRLLSLQASFGILDEFREINPDIFNALQGRLGRYPDKMMNGVGCVTDSGDSNAHLWGATNPPDAETFWEELLSDPPENTHVTIQPSGLSAEADWIQYLPDGYYENLAQGKTEEWIDVYIHAKFGKSLSGLPVFRSFSREQHVAKDGLKANPISNEPLIIGVDAGLNPSAAICQIDYTGRLMVLDALTSESMGALRFVREKLKPLLANKYPAMKSIIIIDPAAFQRAQTDERTVADIFKNEGFLVKPAMTNSIAARIAAVDNYLTRTVDGKPAIVFDACCSDLIKALISKYRYKINTKGQRDDKPEKSHPWSDIADALQYACLHADNGGAFGGAFHGRGRVEVKPAPLRWAV